MREIKFRGKSINFDKWVYGFYLEQDTYNMGSKNKKRDLIGKSTGLIVENSKSTSATPTKKDTIGQYTGTKDKIGKELYEGDIIEIYYGYTGKKYIAWIEYSEEYSQFVTRCKEIIYENEPLGDIEIADRRLLGNIYDNPELLDQ